MPASSSEVQAGRRRGEQRNGRPRQRRHLEGRAVMRRPDWQMLLLMLRHLGRRLCCCRLLLDEKIKGRGRGQGRDAVEMVELASLALRPSTCHPTLCPRSITSAPIPGPPSEQTTSPSPPAYISSAQLSSAQLSSAQKDVIGWTRGDVNEPTPRLARPDATSSTAQVRSTAHELSRCQCDSLILSRRLLPGHSLLPPQCPGFAMNQVGTNKGPDAAGACTPSPRRAEHLCFSS